MKKEQWLVLAGASFVVSIYFWLWTITAAAGVPSILAVETTREAAAWTAGRMYSIAYIILTAFGFVCLINAGLERKAEKDKREEARIGQLTTAYEEDFVMQAAKKMKLKHLPKTMPELHYWAEKEGKKKQADKAAHKFAEISAKVSLKLGKGVEPWKAFSDSFNESLDYAKD